MRVRMIDVANRVGVSRVTVSLVLNGRESEYITDETRRRVLQTAREMGYVRNAAAHALAKGRAGLIGVWVPEFAPYYVELARSVQRIISPDGYEMMLSDVCSLRRPGQGNGLDAPYLAVDGLVVADGAQDEARSAFGGPAGQWLPCVSLSGRFVDGVDHVAIDLVGATKEALGHLAGQGRRRIAYLTPTANLDPAPEGRRDTYRQVMSDFGQEEQILLVDSQSRAAARRAICELPHLSFDALLCHNDEIAVGAYRGLRDLGLRVPDDVALVGCDGIAECEYHDPQLSTIVQPFEKIGAAIWQLLQPRIQGTAGDWTQARIPCRFVARGSSGAG